MENEERDEDREQPSTSKKESQRNNSIDDMYVDSPDDDAANSEMSMPSSGSYSMVSKLDMAATGPDLQKAPITKKDVKSHQKRKRETAKRITGRVEKKRRPIVKRQATRRAPRRKQKPKEEKKERVSMSTIFTRLSSSSQTPGCEYCGHRCCRRRFEYVLRRCFQRRKRRRRNKIRKSNKFHTSYRTEGIQAGSCSNMFSPLFITSNSPHADKTAPENPHSEITPDMIHESIQKLTMWRQDVQTTSILDYLIKNYPVNRDKEALINELLEKLRISALLGIVCRTSENTWSLAHGFQNRTVAKNHVTLFWKMYADTLRPVTAKVKDTPKPLESDKETNTRSRNYVYDEDVL